jgi:chromosome segregation ATPase
MKPTISSLTERCAELDKRIDALQAYTELAQAKIQRLEAKLAEAMELASRPAPVRVQAAEAEREARIAESIARREALRNRASHQ